MLRFLRIRNLAVIDAVEVEFDPGFNVLTGETGAGKSILVEAVGLLLGGRASTDLVRTGEAQATIEAIFETAELPELIVRREISSQGRSRSFINGTLATAAALRDLSEQLVEIHGQHEHQALLDPVTHLPLLDEFGGHQALSQQVVEAWSTVRTLREQLDRSQMNGRERAARLDLITFQLGEIERAGPKAGEDEELAATKQVLASADRIQRLCEESYATLYDSDQAVLGALGGIWKRVDELASIEPQFGPYAEARDAIKSQLEDLAFFLRSYADGIDASPARLQQVEDRLATLERLKRKYGPTLADVITTGENLARERELLTGDGDHGDLERALASASGAFLAVARDLSKRRRKAATLFSGELETLLGELAMARTKFEVRFNEVELAPELWSERGVDQAEFYISPNVGETPRPLTRIVSGGELSRIMLALKTIGIRQRTSPSRNGARYRSEATKTLIFDEVDAGIGGRVADVVGAKLRELGDQFQVLCITHLPQIAARASTQFLIEKSVKGSRTITTVAALEPAARVDEISRMIGGASVTDAVRHSARDLLDAGRSVKAAPYNGTEAKGKYKAKGESESRRRD